MKKVAVISASSKICNQEKGSNRFCYLAEFLTRAGFQVDLIASTFQHMEKKQRLDTDVNVNDLPYGVVQIYEPGYPKNIDLKRIKSHQILAKSLKKHLENHGDYDLIYCAIPPNNVAAVAAKYAQTAKIPFIVDVEDLWPEAMELVFGFPVLKDLLFYPFKRDARTVFAAADGVVGTSQEYADRPFRDKTQARFKEVVYVGNELAAFDQGVLDNRDTVAKPDDEFWVTYAGTLGASYDIKTMILAGKELKNRGYDKIRMIVLGDGPTRKELEALDDQIGAGTKFLGYCPYPYMAAVLTCSDIVLNSFVKKAPQSIVTKIGDYLASGRPMINTCSSPEFRNMVDSEGFGVNVEAEDAGVLADAVEQLNLNPEMRQVMGQKARVLAEQKFDRPRIYQKIVDMINELIPQ